MSYKASKRPFLSQPIKRKASTSFSPLQEKRTKTEIGEILSRDNFLPKDLGGNGDCLFRSVNFFLKDPNFNPKSLRQQACDYLEHNQSQIPSNLLGEGWDNTSEDYIKEMRFVKTYAGMIEVFALAHVLNRVIAIFWALDNPYGAVKFYEKVSVYGPPQAKGEPILLLHMPIELHYMPLIRVEKTIKVPESIKFESQEDSDIGEINRTFQNINLSSQSERGRKKVIKIEKKETIALSETQKIIKKRGRPKSVNITPEKIGSSKQSLTPGKCVRLSQRGK